MKQGDEFSKGKIFLTQDKPSVERSWRSESLLSAPLGRPAVKPSAALPAFAGGPNRLTTN